MIFHSSSASAQSAHAPQTSNRPESAPARFNPPPGRMLDRRARIEAGLRRTLIVARRFVLDDTIRNSHRARRRGWITSSAASVDVNIGAGSEPRRIVIRWRNPGESDDEKPGEDEWKPPVYDDGRRDDCIEGEVAKPAAQLEHTVAAEPEPKPEPDPVVTEPERVVAVPEPDPAVRYERERIDAWIRESPHRLAARLLFALS